MSNQIETQIDVTLTERNRVTALFRLVLVVPMAIFVASFAPSIADTDTVSSKYLPLPPRSKYSETALIVVKPASTVRSNSYKSGFSTESNNLSSFCGIEPISLVRAFELAYVPNGYKLSAGLTSNVTALSTTPDNV